MPATDAVLKRIEREKETYLAELKEYLRFPSISTDPEYKKDVLATANWLAGKMRAAGLKAELIETKGNPLVYGEWLGAPGKPTILFYGHYDVQPVDPIDQWRHPPFEPTEEGDQLVCRGATDDKGQSYTHVKAVAAMLKERGKLPVNVKFIVEGEEESGGHSIDEFVKADKGKKLACDVVVVSDSSMYAPGQPALTYGLKGLVYMELKVTGPNRDLHSGTYGGGIQNPLYSLATIISRLRNPDTGRILIPDFYDDVRPLERWERQEFAKLPFSEAKERKELGVPTLVAEKGYSYREQVWARPTCDVNGIYGGYQGKGAKTVLPSWAGAKVSMRLVPDQRPAKIARQFTQHVKKVTPKGVRVDVSFLHSAEAVLIPTEGPIVDAALEAMRATWGKRPVRIREGGSIPIVTTFYRVLKVPVLLLGFGLHDDRLHSPNEKFNISHFYNGIRAVARLLDQVAATRSPAAPA
jgi:acetylornithine deacetylase/succinyl-diaminopimelate desuccinylase-like protein